MSEGLLLLVAAVWGSSFVFAKEAVALQPVLGFLALRFGLTALLLSPALIAGLRQDAAGLLRAGTPLGTILCAVFLFETYGVANTSATNASVLISLCVMATPFVEWAIIGRRPGKGILLAAACSIAGVALLTGSGDLTVSLGDGLILVAALLRALMVVATQRLTREYAGSSLGLTALQATVTAGLCTAAAVLTAGPDLGLATPTLEFVGMLLWLVVACTIFAFFAQNFAARRTSPSRVSLLMGSEPLFGVLFAVILLGETLGTADWLGAALVIGSCVFAIGSRAERGAERNPGTSIRERRSGEA